MNKNKNNNNKSEAYKETIKAVTRYCAYDCSESRTRCKKKSCSLYPLKDGVDNTSIKYSEVIKRIVKKCRACKSTDRSKDSKHLIALKIDRCNNESCGLYDFRPLHMQTLIIE